MLYQTLRKLDGHDTTMRGLWEKAAKAKPQDLDIQMRWFTYAFEGGDWKSAQKVSGFYFLFSSLICSDAQC